VENDSLHLGLATGHSPKLTYSYLSEHFKKNPSLISNISLFQLDEWLGLAKTDSGSCHYFLHKYVIAPWQLQTHQYFPLDGQHWDQEIQLSEMRKELAQKPLDLCILGIGKNGHLAFNEPGSRLKDPSRIVALADSSKKHTMLKDVKTKMQQGITIGLKEIMEAKEIFLIITGIGKKKAWTKLLDRAPIKDFPASAIFEHNNYSIFVDLESVN
jgi:galactosamine-6-phosphate isomerase